jgi:hypothetical protein
MDVGVVKVAEDRDFEKLKKLIDDHTGWKLDYNKSSTKVWTKSVPTTSFKMIKVPAYSINVMHVQYSLCFEFYCECGYKLLHLASGRG